MTDAGEGINLVTWPNALQIVNIIFSIASIIIWVQVGRYNPRIRIAVWWPISLLVSNALFSVAVLSDQYLIDFVSNVTLNYWGQGVRIQAAITLLVCAWLMRDALRNGKFT